MMKASKILHKLNTSIMSGDIQEQPASLNRG